ncbi:hypothetical protein [Bradyrhizobium sp. 174]|uniref:helix-turn-helix transcriptional regulator n=1 Tax=Bradyrhizobium sp. 174 TaxID=2782645 RepID=UPI001FF8AC3C|nr:hypothetical protein [Bradyrhizobium sp. 174]MCK1570787.1 hypothetical protein [Bradyrhizobium sp. 174]
MNKTELRRKLRRKKDQRQDRRRQLDEMPLNADFFYRLTDGWKFFGLKPTSLNEAIKTGKVPTPVALTDSGRAKGWFGRTILAWQQEREAKAAGKVV